MTKEIQATLRHMAWQRAIGELRSMYETYDHVDRETYLSFQRLAEEFIKEVQYRGLQE